jgi:hypothetical protein
MLFRRWEGGKESRAKYRQRRDIPGIEREYTQYKRSSKAIHIDQTSDQDPSPYQRSLHCQCSLDRGMREGLGSYQLIDFIIDVFWLLHKLATSGVTVRSSFLITRFSMTGSTRWCCPPAMTISFSAVEPFSWSMVACACAGPW